MKVMLAVVANPGTYELHDFSSEQWAALLPLLSESVARGDVKIVREVSESEYAATVSNITVIGRLDADQAAALTAQLKKLDS